MKILGFREESFQDWENKGLCSVIFTAGCNYRCPTCYARRLSDTNQPAYKTEEIIRKLAARKKYVKNLVICGGEPTLQLDLIDFLKEIKKIGLSVNLNTNGSNSDVLRDLLEEKLVDYVAMDIKGPPRLYSQLVGKQVDLRDDVEKWIMAVQNFPDYEFRTTVVPFYSDEGNLRWMNGKDALDMAEWVYGFVPGEPKNVKWYVQKFTARKKDENSMLDERFTKENIPEEYQETPSSVLAEFRDSIRTKFPRAEIR